MANLASNQSVVDIKTNINMRDIKPNNFNSNYPTQIYYDQYSISVGQWIPFAGFTYANNFSGTKIRQ